MRISYCPPPQVGPVRAEGGRRLQRRGVRGAPRPLHLHFRAQVRALRQRHNQRDLLVAADTAPHHHPGRQVVDSAGQDAVDPHLPGVALAAQPPHRHLRYIRRPRRLHRIHERVHLHRRAVLLVSGLSVCL
jgi:hypothetical protein